MTFPPAVQPEEQRKTDFAEDLRAGDFVMLATRPEFKDQLDEIRTRVEV